MSRVVCFVAMVLLPMALYAQEAVDWDRKMVEYGLVDLQSLDGDILVELKYSSEDNFVGVDMYGDLERAYLVPEFAAKVIEAQRILKQRHPHYTLLVYDAARPISVQRAMRRVVEGTELEGFVADGIRGGRHNYGVAVDLTIASPDGEPLDMGAGFDDFTLAAAVKGTPDTSDASTRTIDVYRRYVMGLAADGIISEQAAKNRVLLLEVMCDAGLVPYRREWWHFEELRSTSETRSVYRLLDF